MSSAALAEVAAANSYVRPVVDEGATIEIQGGRHPVVEKLSSHTVFIPNDTLLDDGPNQLHVITGPNSSGKSTVLRQVALITLLAQVGSFVPADARPHRASSIASSPASARTTTSLPVSPTFMVEMTETADILNNATDRSLVILDEIGRETTSTFDGAVDRVGRSPSTSPRRGCKTLFATHYHLLNDLEKSQPNVRNFRIAVKEDWRPHRLAAQDRRRRDGQIVRRPGRPHGWPTAFRHRPRRRNPHRAGKE